jgi:drug/metabolite transporter (DMT)-like permease
LKKKLAPALILVAGALWGAMGLFVHRIDDVFGFKSMQIVLHRALFSAALLAVVIAVRDRGLFRIKPRDIWCFLGTGVASIVFFNFCYFRAIVMTNMAVAACMLYTAPVFVGIMSRLMFREAITAVKALAMVLVFVGCAMTTGIFGGIGGINAPGVLFGLGAGFGYALYSIFGRFAISKGYKPLTVSFYTFAVAAAATLPAAFGGGFFTAAEGGFANVPLLVMFALVTTVLPFMFYTEGLRSVAPGRASVLASVEPVVAAILGAAVLREDMSVMALAGVAVVVASIAIMQSADARANP